MSTAIVHDWLPVFSGAEQVVAAIMNTVGPSDLFSLFNFLDEEDTRRIGAKKIITSYLDRLPFREKYYRYTFPFCPNAIESFDLSAYDLVISSSAAFSKGVIVHPHQKHVAYVHTPVRYAWDQTYEYLRRTWFAHPPFGIALRSALHDLRRWDHRTGNGPDLMVANSSSVRRRIEQIYGRDSVVLHPPVDVDNFALVPEKDDYFVVASRLVPYKRIDLVVEAFRSLPDQRLVVCGDGPELPKLKALAGTNVEFVGHLLRSKLIETIQRARAFIFAAYEDFGIVIAEAQAAGTPVIAYHLGGAKDIVTPLGARNPTGVLFPAQSTTAVSDAVEHFIANGDQISSQACRENALRFSTDQFRTKLRSIIEQVQDSSFSRFGSLPII